MADENNRLRITKDELQSFSVQRNVEGMKEAQKIALVRPIGNQMNFADQIVVS
jgi:hypothetical protein